MKTKIILVMSFFMFFVACKPQSKEIKNISVEDLKTVLNDDIQLIDVRTPEEWKDGIIEGAKKICVTTNDFETKSNKMLDKSKPVYIYCRSGVRSLVAAKILLDNGFSVYNVEGGYNNWKVKMN